MSDNFQGLDLLLVADCPQQAKIDLLTAFKGHVKKTLVNEQMVGRYFENLSQWMLSGAIRGESFQLGHSTLCYLIKRVAMQAQHKFQPKLITMLLSTLLETSNEDKKIWQSSVKALEAIYLAKPSEFEGQLNDFFRDPEYRTKVLLLIDELVKIESVNGRNAVQLLQKFVPSWVIAINQVAGVRASDVELMYEIISKYYSEQLMRSLVQSITDPTASKIFSSRLPGASDGNFPETSGSNADLFDSHSELQSILESAPQFPAVQQPPPINYSNMNYLSKDLEALIPPFKSLKETEQNWKQRQENVIKLRSIILGNVSKEFPDKFLDQWKELNLQECLTKAALSLRTSLCTHGCCFIKDFCCIFNSILDTSVVENLWACLAKLMSNTKKISNQNAYICAITLLSTVPFHSRLFNHCFALIRDKNNASRLYSSTFLRILIIRYHKRLVSQHHVYVEEWLQKGLTDAQTTIRESMRVTFWYWYKVSPMSGKKMLNLLPPQLRRALEACIPSKLMIDYDNSAPISSNNSSRRSSLLPKRFPSYAAPTQSSHLPRSSIKRSLTDLASGPTSLIKRSLRTPPEQDLDIDLTSEITDSHTNPLLHRYMKKENTEQLPLSVTLTKTPEHGLELLQKYLLSSHTVPNDIEKPLLLIIKSNPKAFKPLLQVPNFYRLIPLNLSLILLCLNELDISMLLSEYSAQEIIINIKTILMSLDSHESEWNMFYVRYRYQLYNFCFMAVKILVKKDDLSTELVKELINACGKDMDGAKYYEMILHIYYLDKEYFIKQLKETTTASTKLKIANEIQKVDADFKIKTILNQSFSADSLNMPEEKHLIEMTMVNPLQKRNLSTNTVVHNPLSSDEENEIEDKIVALDDVRNGFTKYGGLSKLTEMTKVHSVFQPEHINENLDEKELEMHIDSPVEQKSLLTEIFSKGESNEAKVKFSDAPFTIVTDHDYDSNMLSDAINGMDIETNGESASSNAEENSIIHPLSPEKQVPKISLAEIVSALHSDSLVAFELRFIDSLIGPASLDQLKEIIHSITNHGTFKMNELHYIIRCLIANDQDVLNWCLNERELKSIWSITQQLLSSSSSEAQMPTNIAYKSIVLATCLIIIDNISGNSLLQEDDLKELLLHVTSLVSKLDSYENEIYYVSTELRKVLLSHAASILPILLENCITELCGNTEQYMVKITYLLESVTDVVDRIGAILSVDVLRKLAKTISRFIPSNQAEWRYASCNVLSSIYNLLLARNTPIGYIRSLMPLLSPSDFELVRSLATKADKTRHVK